jgi:outer membrane autotransporter protein
LRLNFSWLRSVPRRSLWGEINAGISGQVTSTTTLFANASYQSRFGGDGFAYTGKAGLRVNW